MIAVTGAFLRSMDSDSAWELLMEHTLASRNQKKMLLHLSTERETTPLMCRLVLITNIVSLMLLQFVSVKLFTLRCAPTRKLFHQKWQKRVCWVSKNNDWYLSLSWNNNLWTWWNQTIPETVI